jgi:hypothetical protein
VVGVPAALDGGGVKSKDRPGEPDPKLAVTLLSDPLDGGDITEDTAGELDDPTAVDSG